MKTSSIQLVLFASVFVLLQGCTDCTARPIPRGRGEVRIIYTDAANTQLSGDNGIYDFGTV